MKWDQFFVRHDNTWQTLDEWASLGNTGAREMEFVLLDGGEDGKYSGFGFVEISKVIATRDAFIVGPAPEFDWVAIVLSVLASPHPM